MQRQIVFDLDIQPGEDINTFDVAVQPSGNESGIIRQIDPCIKSVESLGLLIADKVIHSIQELIALALSCEPKTIAEYIKLPRESLSRAILNAGAAQNMEIITSYLDKDKVVHFIVKVKDFFIIGKADHESEAGKEQAT